MGKTLTELPSDKCNTVASPLFLLYHAFGMSANQADWAVYVQLGRLLDEMPEDYAWAGQLEPHA